MDAQNKTEKAANNERLCLAEWIGLPVLALAFVFVFHLMAVGLINNLPRSMEGESVTISWPISLLAALTFQVGAPIFVAQFIFRQRKSRAYFCACTLLVIFVFYAFAGGGDVLSKAWRRGL